MTPDLLSFLADGMYALVLGMAIGIEREWRQHAGHLAAQVVSGLGFLGGGVILRDGFSVRGLATSATLWAAGAVGVLVGVGFRWHAGWS